MAAFLPVGNGQFADERMDQCLCIGEMTAGLLDRLRQQMPEGARFLRAPAFASG